MNLLIKFGKVEYLIGKIMVKMIGKMKYIVIWYNKQTHEIN